MARGNASQGPIDAFLAARIAEMAPQLRPSPAADRTTLIRRLMLDLIGLPPSPLEVETLVRDASSGSPRQHVNHFCDFDDTMPRDPRGSAIGCNAGEGSILGTAFVEGSISPHRAKDSEAVRE